MAQLLDRLLDSLDQYREKNKSVPILVEGRNDIRSLRSLGFHGEIHTINSGQTVMKTVESLSRNYDEIIVLPDLDRTGRVLKEKITRYVSGQGKSADLGLWNSLDSMGVTMCIEDLPTALRSITERTLIGKKINRNSIRLGVGIKR